MDDFFKIVAAGPAFFVSAWLLMLFAGTVQPFGYLTSMVVTIALWLTLAPAIGAIARTGKPRRAEGDGAIRDGTQNRLIRDAADGCPTRRTWRMCDFDRNILIYPSLIVNDIMA